MDPRRAGVIVAMALATQIGALRLADRPWVPTEEPLKLWDSDIYGPGSSQHVLDPYAFSHICHGLVFYALLMPMYTHSPWRAFVVAALLETTWEILENTVIAPRYVDVTAFRGYEGDTVVNSVADTVMALLGFGLAWYMPWQASIALFLGIEMLMLIFCRDNLTLNVLMLLAPSDLVRNWQLHKK